MDHHEHDLDESDFVSRGKDITKVVVLATVAIVALYDIIIYNVSGVDATVSRVTLSWASDLPIIPLVIGVVIGHLFWSQPRSKK